MSGRIEYIISDLENSSIDRKEIQEKLNRLGYYMQKVENRIQLLEKQESSSNVMSKVNKGLLHQGMSQLNLSKDVQAEV